MGSTCLLLAAGMVAIGSPEAEKYPGLRTQSPDNPRILLGTWIAPPLMADANYSIQKQYGYACKLEFLDGRRINIGVPGAGEGGTYRLDLKPSPAAIDYIDADGRTSHGILRLQGAKLWICWATSGAERPAAFVQGPQTVVIVLQRATE